MPSALGMLAARGRPDERARTSLQRHRYSWLRDDAGDVSDDPGNPSDEGRTAAAKTGVQAIGSAALVEANRDQRAAAAVAGSMAGLAQALAASADAGGY